MSKVIQTQNRAIVQYGQQPEDGKQYQHNFQNRHIESSSLQKPSKAVADAIAQYTQNQINDKLGIKAQQTGTSVAAQMTNNNQPTYIKYTPDNQGLGTNSGAAQRIIKVHQKKQDPLAPNEYKHKKTLPGSGSPPPTIVHSPTRKLTAKDKEDWKIPPCISNWKNVHGFTVPLEQRIRADGRSLQQHTINEKFAHIADAFQVAEKTSRQEIEERNQLKKSMVHRKYLEEEEIMKQAARKAREQNELLKARQKEDQIILKDLKQKDAQNQVKETLSQSQSLTKEEERDRKERDTLRQIRLKELEREQRLANAGVKKSKQVRDEERDISEKIALGQAQPSNNTVLFDQRLYNQQAGMDTGFTHDDEYDVYDTALFTDRTQASIYKNIKKDTAEEDENDDLEKVLTKHPERSFGGGGEGGKVQARSGPVRFEKLQNNELFGMGSFVDESHTLKKVKK